MYFVLLQTGPLSVNTYLIGARDSDTCVVIDPGASDPVLDRLAQDGKTLTHILLTHGHYDHIGGVTELKEKTNAMICIGRDDADMLQGSVRCLASFLHGRQIPVDADRLLDGNESIETAGLLLETISAQGHTKGGICYLLKDEGILFAGDTMFRESYGRTDFPGGSPSEMKKSIRMLLDLDGDYRVLTGHGEETTLAYERLNNPLR